MSVWIWIAIAVGCSLIVALIVYLFTKSKIVGKINYMYDAIEDGEMNFKFKEPDALNKSLNRLRGIFEKQRITNEQESWNKLIRVLTHEIMNALTPVVSLSEALIQESEQGELSQSEMEDGLKIISDSSKNLMEFVNTYRRITGLSQPIRKSVDLKSILAKLFKLNNSELVANNIHYRLNYSDEPTDMRLDEIQVLQVLQNLLKNSIEAECKIIEVSLKSFEDGRTALWFKNDGKPVPHSLWENIFIPFYTTKTNGSGIGLSVCRQILRNHNASIDLLRSNNEETVFEIIFN